MHYQEMSRPELEALHEKLKEEYRSAQALSLKLDMSRGKPEPAQLDLSAGLLTILNSDCSFTAENGMDCRNYGGLEGIPEARRLFAEMLDIAPDEIIVGGNSSLTMMYDAIARCMLHGVDDRCPPWASQSPIKFLCPCPGYDRHFAICEYFGIGMIPIPMTPTGPDMDKVEHWVGSDPTVKGIWCVPKYSNPQGYTYSDETVRRFAALRPAAADFRIFWDDAYAVHHLNGEGDHLLNIMDECKALGSQDMLYIFASTSKISFAGAGVAMMAASVDNIRYITRCMAMQTISYDKLNQLRHVRFYKNLDGIRAHMLKHRAIIKPKFELMFEKFRELHAEGIADFTEPNGGYFIALMTLNGCARRVVQLCREAGVTLTGAGACFPYGHDPYDSCLRIAPTYPPLEDLRTAADILCLCVRLASVEQLLKD